MKMKNKISMLLLAIVIIASSCSKTFDTYAVNNNQPTSVPAYLLLRQIENSLFVAPAGDEDKFGQYTLSTTLIMAQTNIGLVVHLYSTMCYAILKLWKLRQQKLLELTILTLL